jgi:hypothetical protein
MSPVRTLTWVFEPAWRVSALDALPTTAKTGTRGSESRARAAAVLRPVFCLFGLYFAHQ